MKLAIFSGVIPSTTFIERLILQLAENGVEIILHGLEKEKIKYPVKKIKVIGYKGSFSKVYVAIKYFLLIFFSNPKILPQLRKTYLQSPTKQTFSNWFVKVAPIIWHQPDIFHLQWAKGIDEWIFLKDFGVKLIVSLRGAHINYSPVADKNVAETYFKFFPQVDGFHGVSKAICNEAGKYNAAPEKCRVVYSGLKLNEFRFKKEKLFNFEELKIVSVGRSHWVKGYPFALDAMKILKEKGVDFEYRIIGGTDEELIFQTADLNLEDVVKLEGNLSFDKVKKAISEADVLLLPSVEEGVPNVILEAMALGTLVCASDCGGVYEVLKDGVNGFVFSVRSAASIAKKIEHLTTLTEAEINLIRRNARETIEEQHNHQKMVEDMIGLYSFALKNETQTEVSQNAGQSAVYTTNI